MPFSVFTAISVLATGWSCMLDPSLPANLTVHAAEQPLCAGFLNASAPPYSACGDGITDDTAAIQAALDDGYRHRMAVILPAGKTFLISKQLRAVENGMPIAHREYGYQLIGARGSSPPTIKVIDHATLSDFPAFYNTTVGGKVYEVRAAIFYALFDTPGHNDSPSTYSMMLRNVDIDLGNNPQLSGVYMSGAQLCSIEDVRIHGVAFTAGVVGLPGSGGFSANIEVTGGAFAVWEWEFRPNPSITGLVALEQSVAGILLENSRGPLVVSGFVIRSALEGAAGVIVQIQSWMARTECGGDASIALEDGLIQLTNESVAVMNTDTRDVSINSVWVQANFFTAGVASDSQAVKRINRWAHTGGTHGCIAIAAGKNASAAARSAFGTPSLQGLAQFPTATPPSDETLRSMHSWTRADANAVAWSADKSIVIDAWRDCGATPNWSDASDDDGAALTKCFAQAAGAGRPSVVFLPRGLYDILEPLALPAGTKLIGAGKHCASLLMHVSEAFAMKEGLPNVLLLDANGGEAEHSERESTRSVEQTTVVSDLVLIQAQRSTLLEVRSAKTWLRDVRTVPCTHSKRSVNQPVCFGGDPATLPPGPSGRVGGVVMTGAASGKFYGFSLDHFGTFLVPGDALVVVANSSSSSSSSSIRHGSRGEGEIHIYQLSAEHLSTDYQVQVWRSRAVHLHAFKYESAGFAAHPDWGPSGGGLFACHGSKNVSIFGGSGNFGIMNVTMSPNIIFSWGCDDLRIDSIVRKPQDQEVPASKANWIHATSSAAGAKPLIIDDGSPIMLLFSPLPLVPAAAVVEEGREEAALSSFCDSDGDYTLVWADEFSGTELNATTWTVPIGVGSSFGRTANVTVANTYIENGNLVLRSQQLAGHANNYTTGAAITHSRGANANANANAAGASWRYGRFCVRAKLPGAGVGKSQGLWPAHWMMPSDYTRHCGYNELDIMEMINGDTQSHSTYWSWGPNASNSGPPGSKCKGPPTRAGPSTTVSIPDFYSAFHEYAVEWTPTAVKFYVDGKLASDGHGVFTNKTTLPVNDHYMMLNTAVGGGWPGAPNASTVWPAYHYIDYVRVSQRQ